MKIQHEAADGEQSKTAGSAREGGNTQPASVESARPTEVDVEAERPSFEAYIQGDLWESPVYLRRLDYDPTAYHIDAIEARWQGWLAKARTQAAARTQADAGQFLTTKPENT